MARVVQRRSNPPYVLILMVFLMLVAAAMAVYFYTSMDKAIKDRDTAREANALLVTNDLSDPAIVALRDAAAKSNGRLSVVGQLKQQVQMLAMAISPSNRTYAGAMAIVDEHSKKYGAEGLVAQVEQAQSKIDELQKQTQKLNEDLAAAMEEKNNAISQIQKMADTQKTEFANFDTKLQDLTRKASESDTEYQKRLADIRTEVDKKIEEYGKNINEKTALISKLQEEIAKSGRTIEEQKARIRELEGKAGPASVVVRPDGKITKVVEGDKVCYINIGANDRVAPGMTFAVYSAATFGENAVPKATIKVNRPNSVTSECLIIKEDNRDPISADDVVSNLAFDSMRDQTFIIEGMFDLRGNGRPEESSTAAVKDMVSRSGSKVTDTLDSQVDFVVLGEPPVRPPKPAEGADPQAEKLFRDKEKEVQRYNEISSKAREMKIPVLNGNRFLMMVGYGSQGK